MCEDAEPHSSKGKEIATQVDPWGITAELSGPAMTTLHTNVTPSQGESYT